MNLLLFVLAILGIGFVVPSALPQYLIHRYVFRQEKAILDWRTLFSCPICYGFWTGVFIGLFEGQDPLLTGLAASGILGIFNWLKTTLYAWAWGMRLHFSREGQIHLEKQDLHDIFSGNNGKSGPSKLDSGQGPGLNLIKDYSRFEDLVKRQTFREDKRGE